MSELKECTECKQQKPLTEEFWGKPRNDNGKFRSQCKICRSVKMIKYNELNPEKKIKNNERMISWYDNLKTRPEEYKKHLNKRNEFERNKYNNLKELNPEEYKKYRERKNKIMDNWIENNFGLYISRLIGDADENAHKYNNWYPEQLKRQNNKCAICNSDSPGSNRKRWCIDHDHNTKKLRGLLCISCNIFEGRYTKYKKSGLLDKMHNYLKQHE